MSSSLFDGVSIAVEVSFADASAAPTWTDVSAKVQSLSFQRGRQRELERPEPGTLVATLDNSAREFDPSNTAGAHYPFVLPMRHVRVTATRASVTYELWRGYVDSWHQSWELPSSSTVTLTATDILKVLANRTLDDAYKYEISANSPVCWLRLGESAGNEILDEISQRFGSFSGTLTGADALTVGASDGAILFNGSSNRVLHRNCAKITAAPFSVECWFKTTSSGLQLIARQGSGSENDGWFISMGFGAIIAGASFISTTSIATTSTWNDGATHHLVYVRTASTQTIYVDGVAQPTTSDAIASSAYEGVIVGGSSKANDWFNGTIDEVAVYNVALTAAQILTHYTMGVTPWDQDFTGERIGRLLVLLGFSGVLDTGITNLGLASSLGGANALDYILSVVQTEGGNLFVDGSGDIVFIDRHSPVLSASTLTIGDSAGETDFASIQFGAADELLRNKVTVERDGGVAQTVDDSGSITDFLTQDFTLTGLLLDTDLESLNHAQWILGRYKDPVDRIESVTLTPRRDPSTAYAAILPRELGDKVTVNVRPSTGATITQTAIIESLRHDITPSSWQVTFGLSPAETRTYLVVGSSTLGKIGTGRFGY